MYAHKIYFSVCVYVCDVWFVPCCIQKTALTQVSVSCGNKCYDKPALASFLRSTLPGTHSYTCITPHTHASHYTHMYHTHMYHITHTHTHVSHHTHMYNITHTHTASHLGVMCLCQRRIFWDSLN